MAAIDEKIESEIRSLLDFSVVDVVPVAPVGLNLGYKTKNCIKNSKYFLVKNGRMC